MELILLLVSSLLLTAAAAASNPVLDVAGNGLRRGHLYYARSVMRPGGGLTLAAPNASCPLNVAQAPFYDYSGRPLAFFPENAADDTVKEGNTLYVMFPEPTGCPQSTVWTLDGDLVTTGGTESSAVGPHYSRFAIRKAGASSSQHYYQMEVCPCSIGVERGSCRMGCVGSLGLIKAGENILLGVNSERRPHTIMFVKVKKQVPAVSSR